MSQIYASGHSIEIKGGRLLIDGKAVDAKLKHSLSKGISIVSSGSVINSFSDGGLRVTGGTSKININGNTIVIKGDKITVNGKEVDLNAEASANKEVADEKFDEKLDKKLNKDARKYLISTSKDDEIEIDGVICRRIIALEDIVDENGTVLVKKGEKGGYVQSRKNLSEEGCCWIYDDALVFGSAKVSENAKVRDDAQIYGNCKISGRAEVCDNAEVYGNVVITDDAKVTDNAEVYGNVVIRGKAKVSDNAEIYGNTTLCDEVEVSDNAEIYGNCQLSGKVKVGGNVEIYGSVVLSGERVIKKESDLVANFNNKNGIGKNK